MKKLVLTLAYLFLCSSTGYANDSSAALGAGGLIPTKSKHVRMQKELLNIRPKQISVDYVFENSSTEDETTIVSFPLPDLDMRDFVSLGDRPKFLAFDKQLKQSLLNFTVEVDGTSVPFKIEQKAFLGDKDVTSLFDELHLSLIPLMPDPESYGKRLLALTSEQRAKLFKSGIIDEDSFKEDHSEEDWEWKLRYNFIVKTKYYWQQTFPANRKIKIHHTYTPILGFSFGPFGVSTDKDEVIDLAKEIEYLNDEQYCGDKSDFFKSPPQEGEKNYCRSRGKIDYILTTANTWAGSISDFSLVLEDMPYVFTCFKGLKRTGPARWEFQTKDFVPTEDLSLSYCPANL